MSSNIDDAEASGNVWNMLHSSKTQPIQLSDSYNYPKQLSYTHIWKSPK